MKVSKTKFIKDLKSIIRKEKYRVDLFNKGKYIGCLNLGCVRHSFRMDFLRVEDIMADIEIEKRTKEYDYEKDDGSTRTYLAMWIETQSGYCYYEFDEWKIKGGEQDEIC